jgi:hypothetical protein
MAVFGGVKENDLPEEHIAFVLRTEEKGKQEASRSSRNLS